MTSRKLSSRWGWKLKTKVVGRLAVLLLTGIWYFSPDVVAQALVNNNAMITITNDTRMTVLGAALNNGDLLNSGTLSISGDWMNADTYTTVNGRFILDGTDEQTITHNGQQVYQLILSGGGDKEFTTSMQVMDTLDLMDGNIVITNGSTLLVETTGTVVGGSEDSFVDGPLFHQGTGYKYFPVGKDGNFRPVELLNVTGTDPVIGMQMNQPNDNPRIPLQLQTVSETRYWEMTQGSGSYDGSLIRVKLGPDEMLGENYEMEDVVVASVDSLDGLFTSIGQSLFSGSVGDGEVTSALPAMAPIYALAVEGFAEERGLYVPNALSPAAPDPEDQVAKVYGQQILDQDFSFQIYNRWGQLVYETNSFAEANTVGWRGESAGGGEEPIGVYQYILTGTFASGNSFKRHGTIKVIR